MGFLIDLAICQRNDHNYMLCIIALSCFFFWHKCSTVVVVGVQTSFLPFAKSVTEKNNSRVDCAEADKKTMQAQRNEGRGFLAAGDFALRSCP